MNRVNENRFQVERSETCFAFMVLYKMLHLPKIMNMFETHPHQILKYCPKCGSKLFVPQKDNSFTCHSCGFRYYYNAASAVAAIIIDHQGNLLLTKRGIEPKKGTFDLPGGFVSEDESSEEAVVREVREELGVDLLEIKYVKSYANRYEYSGMTVFTNDACFICKIAPDAQLKANDDVSDFLWVNPQTFDLTQIGLDSIRRMVADFVASR